MQGTYLVPANSKKSQLLLGIFKPIDLVIAIVGFVTTLFILIILKNPTVVELIIAITPLVITGFLVFPVPNYHNVLQLIMNIGTYTFGRKKYYWKGWCVRNDFK